MSAPDEAAEPWERAARVAAILGVPCGTCNVRPGEPCLLWRAPDKAVLQLHRDGYDVTMAHLTRVARAIRLGRLSREDLAAQCGGTLPLGVAVLAGLGGGRRPPGNGVPLRELRERGLIRTVAGKGHLPHLISGYVRETRDTPCD